MKKIQGTIALMFGFTLLSGSAACVVDDEGYFVEEENVGTVEQAQSGHCGGVCWVCDDTALVTDSNGNSCKADFDHLACTTKGPNKGCQGNVGYACVYKIRGEEGTACQASETAIGYYTCDSCADAGGSFDASTSSGYSSSTDYSTSTGSSTSGSYGGAGASYSTGGWGGPPTTSSGCARAWRSSSCPTRRASRRWRTCSRARWRTARTPCRPAIFGPLSECFFFN